MTDLPRSRFDSGNSVAVIAAGGAALVDAPPNDPTVALFEDHLARGIDFGTLIASLLQVGLASLPAFAVVATVEDGYRVLVRGSYAADVVSEGVASRLSAGGVSVWREEAFGALSSVVLSSGSAPNQFPFSIVAGTVPAGALEWLQPSAQHSMDAAALNVAAVPTDSDGLSTDLTDQDRGADLVDAEDDPVPPSGPDSPIQAAPPVGDSQPAPEDAEHTVFRAPEPEPEPEPDPEPVPEPEPEPELTNDGHTIVRVKLTDETATKEVVTLIDEVPSNFRPQDPSAVHGAAPVGASTGSAPTPEDPDHDGRTEIRKPQGPVATAPVGAPTPVGSAPTVHAVSCPAGHPNPVTQGRCRQCDSEIVERMAMTIQRPPLGFLRFSTNQVVDVDGPIVIGRMPPTDPIGGSRPQVMAIDNSELSRFHALVTVDDWFVYVADQGSTNGLSVTPPGREPVTCRAHEPMQLQPGSIVNLGGVVTFRFDVI